MRDVYDPLIEFLEKLGIKSAKYYKLQRFFQAKNKAKYHTGKNVKLHINGVEMKYAEGLEYDLNNTSDLTLPGSDD